MTRFVVDLGDLALSKEVTATIESDIQKLVLGHIAGLRIDKPILSKFPKEWIGLIARYNIEHLLDGEKQLNQAFNMRAAK